MHYLTKRVQSPLSYGLKLPEFQSNEEIAERLLVLDQELKRGRILDTRTLALSQETLRFFDAPREMALWTAAHLPRRIAPEDEKKLVATGWQPVSEQDEVILQESILELSGETLAPSEHSTVRILPSFREDRLFFVHCTHVDTRTRQRDRPADPVLPLPKNVDTVKFVQRVLPAEANYLADTEEALHFVDERRLGGFRRAGMDLSVIQAEIEGREELSPLDITSMYLVTGAEVNSVCRDPDGRHAIRQGFNRGLPGARVGRVIQDGQERVRSNVLVGVNNFLNGLSTRTR